jgi:hypothetical protein
VFPTIVDRCTRTLDELCTHGKRLFAVNPGVVVVQLVASRLADEPNDADRGLVLVATFAPDAKSAALPMFFASRHVTHGHVTLAVTERRWLSCLRGYDQSSEHVLDLDVVPSREVLRATALLLANDDGVSFADALASARRREDRPAPHRPRAGAPARNQARAVTVPAG